jgi:hypothetical protein
MTNRDPGQHGNPMNHPDEPAAGADGKPKFGRLLLVLLVAVALIVVITFVSEAMYS